MCRDNRAESVQNKKVRWTDDVTPQEDVIRNLQARDTRIGVVLTLRFTRFEGGEVSIGFYGSTISPKPVLIRSRQSL